MERKELTEIVGLMIDQALADTHTATIARVTAVNEKTIDCQPVINRVVNGQSVQLPVFIEVPPVFMGGASFPISTGDYALLIFTERCFDRWYNGNDFQRPLELRMHDYSDALAFVGLQNSAGALTIPDAYTFPGDVEITGDLNIEGDLNITGNVTVTGGDVVADGISLKTHTHSGVTTGGGASGPPLP